MDRGHHRRVDQAAVGERKEVEAVVDDVELVGVLEHRRRCAVHSATFGSMVSSSDQPRCHRRAQRCAASPSRRSRTEVTSCPRAHQAFGEQRGKELPGAVVAWGVRHAIGASTAITERLARRVVGNVERPEAYPEAASEVPRYGSVTLGRDASLGLDDRFGFVALRRPTP